MFFEFSFSSSFCRDDGRDDCGPCAAFAIGAGGAGIEIGRRQVIQLALDAGYEAHEAFTRAFKAAYGVSPAEFRRAAGPVIALAAPSGVHYPGESL